MGAARRGRPLTAFVAYFRVSTQKQGQSGLGLEAQKEVVRRHVERCGGTITAEFIEVESGKRADRPQLASALALCKKSGATLIIAKLDRLARNVAFIANLMDAGVDFTACDLPQASRLTIHILAAVAENEAKAISERTKAALAAKKAQGFKLGGYRGPMPAETRAAINAGIRAAVKERDAEHLPTILALHRDGKSHGQIAKFLNTTGKRTHKGIAFTRQTVGIIIRRNA
jgi:DNA invertase Pin-like site-specific DNA recombinase